MKGHANVGNIMTEGWNCQFCIFPFFCFKLIYQFLIKGFYPPWGSSPPIYIFFTILLSQCIQSSRNSGKGEIIELLISNCADINAKTFYGSTPLHGAVLGGNPEAVELLLSKGAEVNAKFRPSLIRVRTPLDYARRIDIPKDGKREIIDLLRKHGGKKGRELKTEEKWNTRRWRSFFCFTFFRNVSNSAKILVLVC